MLMLYIDPGAPESGVSIEASALDELETKAERFAGMYAHQHPMKGLARFMLEASAETGWDAQLAHGVADRIAKNFSTEKGLSKIMIARQAMRLTDSLEGLRAEQPFYKARSFNYLVDPGTSLSDFTEQSLENAGFWVSLLGTDFFERTASGGRSEHYRAVIGNSGFALTAKPGSGASTFSLDLAIAYNRYGDERDFNGPPHELWRLGIDSGFGADSEDVSGRIIRTGGATKNGDELKTHAFDRFRRDFASMPHRLLTFCSMYVMYEFGFRKAQALTTQGAEELSSLKNSKGCVSYTDIHRRAGFKPGNNKWWLEIQNLQEELPRLIASPAADSGMSPHEPAAVHLLIDAFNNLSNSEGQPLPVRIFQQNNRPKIAREISALLDLQGYYQIR